MMLPFLTTLIAIACSMRAMVFCAVMLCIDRQPDKQLNLGASGIVATAVIILFFALSAANTVSSVMVCQFGPCPDDPTQYLWKF
jgi:hypothetical protein